MDNNVEKEDDEVNCENSDVNINFYIDPENASIIGKVFASKDDAYSFYNDYSFNHGFEIRIHGHTKSRTNQEVIRWTPMVKNLVYELNRNGMKPSTITRVVNAISGSEEVDITSKQCTNLLRAERKNHMRRECHGIVKHIHEKSKLDGSHYFSMDLASDGLLKSILWADGRSISSYSQFGDVLMFDVTLRWAMRNAIRNFIWNTRHWFYAWHINKHVIEHLHPYTIRHTDFGETYSKWQKSKTIEEFELRREIMQSRYNIAKGSWLDDMYIQRYYWVKVYLKDYFTAGMTIS
uniref:Protein FAR1-RELATED SEQUENCE n=2 Tax=Kalanchoe fedtschenkoi TaxID=63787 RepID=A0A7N0TU22_KALFE